MEKLAIIDMGSNSIRFVVIQIADNNSYSLLYQQKESIRLGEGLSTTKMLSQAGMERAMTCLKVYQHMMHVMEIQTCRAVATAAVRNAENGEQFLQRIIKETGIDIEIISGEREAYLGYLGVINTIAMKDFVLFDLGGASVEISLVQNSKVAHSVSIPIGAVTLTEKFHLQNTCNAEDLQECAKYIQTKIRDIPWLKDIDLPLIGIGGTVRNFAKMDQRATSYPIPKLHNYILPYNRFEELYELVSSKNYTNRKKISGLSSERADIIVAGAAVIDCLLDLTGNHDLTISGCGLREGLFFEYYRSYCGHEGIWIKDILEFSTTNFLGTLDKINESHIEQVMHVACRLFDLLQGIHGYGQRERRLLETAARLHDVGKVINYYDHARHSAFMIGHAPLYGMTHKEQIITAFIAGFHHGISNKTYRSYRYSHFPDSDDWIMIRRLSTLLALAEASDVTYEHIVKDVSATVAENVVVLVLTVSKNANTSAADYEMNQYLKQFKKEFGLTLLLIWK
jgi:exopolyphosphatase/guanosine-5'-triphosphate,3'-diphosphate pyrophosphatase